MVPERFGTLRPDGEVRAPDFLLVPLLAFDRRGYRLGYGAGYYDRTLAGCRGGSGWAWPMRRRNWTKCRRAPTTRGWTPWRPSAA